MEKVFLRWLSQGSQLLRMNREDCPQAPILVQTGPVTTTEPAFMLELSILGSVLLWVHLRIRSAPLRLRQKLIKSIGVYEHFQSQRRALLLTMKPHETPALIDTLTHLDHRIRGLETFIRTVHNRYTRLYRDPYTRVLLRLPTPPSFEP